MGLFGRRSSKNAGKKNKKQQQQQQEAAPATTNTTVTKKKALAPTPATKKPPKAAPAPPPAKDPTLEHIPQLLSDIQSASTTDADKPARALRMLFSLSEDATNANRTHMVTRDESSVVPTLLQFLQDCSRGSSEQYLALLVLNNISIPSPNKRIIALQHGGAKILARLLCDDPSCHLMAIILVNLTFADAELRRDLADPELSVISSLAYVLKLSAMTESEFENVESLDDDDDIAEKLQTMTLTELKLRPATSDLDFTQNPRGKDLLLSPDDLVYAETARWCLAALKNLTRPSTSPRACITLHKSGVLPLILRMITTVPPSARSMTDASSVVTDTAFTNATLSWGANSMQDAALFCVLNLAATPESRAVVMESDGVQLLSLIAEYEATDISVDEANQMEFQSLKARMALSFLVGSTGHFGQPRGANKTATYSNSEDSVILLSESEAELMVELLANTFSNRAKEGPGGYSAATFHVKWVLYSIRCLLTHSMNQKLFAKTTGPRLNALLMKALAEHAVKDNSTVDAEAAEYAVFSLYLQSNYGFKTQFLPAVYGNHDKIKGTGSLAAKVMTSYLRMKNVTPAGRHAADQLMFRMRYLNFKGSVSELANPPTLPESDFAFDEVLLEKAEAIVVDKRAQGSRPSSDVFGRPIIRTRVPKKGSSKAPWENTRSVRIFPSALLAVQELSFGSSRIRHMEAFDDIMVANNIANSANGDQTESYNYTWTWQDESGGKNFDRQRSNDSMFSTSTAAKRFQEQQEKQQQKHQADGPLTFFGMTCGPSCATDTTK